MDILNPEQRSKRMRMVKSLGTKPERIVGGIVAGLGYKHKSNRKELPGSPDLVFEKNKKVIFVHGCFWHLHSACRKDHKPRHTKTKKAYWEAKLEKNRLRDARVKRQLNRMGWSYLVVWECQLRKKALLSQLQEKIRIFLKY